MTELICNFQKGQIKECPTIYLMIKLVKHFSFHFNQGILWNLFMNNLFVDCLDFQRINFVHFWCDVHGCDSDDVKLRNRNGWCRSHEKSVHQLNARKVRLVNEFVWLGNFDHPIEHSRSELAVNFMIFEEVIFVERHYFMFLNEVFAINFVVLFCDWLGLLLLNQSLFFIALRLISSGTKFALGSACGIGRVEVESEGELVVDIGWVAFLKDWLEVWECIKFAEFEWSFDAIEVLLIVLFFVVLTAVIGLDVVGFFFWLFAVEREPGEHLGEMIEKILGLG